MVTIEKPHKKLKGHIRAIIVHHLDIQSHIAPNTLAASSMGRITRPRSALKIANNN